MHSLHCGGADQCGKMVSIFLQAAGVLLLLWLLVGWLVLGKDRGGTAVYVCRTGCLDQAEAFLRGLPVAPWRRRNKNGHSLGG